MVSIYLAGPIRHSEDPYSWRERVAESYEVETLNPIVEYDASVDNVNVICDATKQAPDEIVGDLLLEGEVEYEGELYIRSGVLVRRDKELIDKADAVLAKDEDVQRTGTPMEVFGAYTNVLDSTAVAVWRPDDGFPSMWLYEHCDFYSSDLDECVNEIQERVNMHKTPSALRKKTAQDFR